jgi:hypothetical protein
MEVSGQLHTLAAWIPVKEPLVPNNTTNEDNRISECLEVDPVEKKLAQLKQKWWNHVNGMEDIR